MRKAHKMATSGKHVRRGRGRPSLGADKKALLTVRWPPHVLDGIDEYCERHSIGRPEALRQIVELHLRKRGILA